MTVSILLTSIVLLAGGVVLALAGVRLALTFRSVRRRFDGGHGAMAPILDRVAVSVGSLPVTMVLDATDVGEPSAVPLVKSCLAQRYRNLEVVVVDGGTTIRPDLELAFGMIRTGRAGPHTVYRSKADERLTCVVVGRGTTEPAERINTGVSVASGDLIFPVHPAWQLRPRAVAEMSAQWVRSPRLVATFAVIHPRTAGRGPAVGLASVRADLLAAAGLGEGSAALGAVGALASGQDGCLAGMLRRESLTRVGGLKGPLHRGTTWSRLAAELQCDGHDRGAPARVWILPQPVGRTNSTGRGWVASSPDRILERPRNGLWWTGNFLQAARFVPFVTLGGVVAAVLGALTGEVRADALWAFAATPVLFTVVVLIGLVIDDRAFRPVAGTKARLQLLAGAVLSSAGGVVGSPLRWTAGDLH